MIDHIVGYTVLCDGSTSPIKLFSVFRLLSILKNYGSIYFNSCS